MKKLLLMRHSEAMPADFDTNDFDRRLTSKGKLLIQQQAKAIQAMQINIERIYTSNSIRTMQTSGLLVQSLAKKIEIIEVPFLYHNYTTQSFIDLVHTFNHSDSCVAVIGHNPEITQITQKLINGYTPPFRPADFALIAFDIELWTDLAVFSGKLITTHHAG